MVLLVEVRQISERFLSAFEMTISLATKVFLSFMITLLLQATPVMAATPGEVIEGGVLRDAVLYGFAGDFRRLSELHGKPLIINVWASWCGPCREEMSSLDRLAQQYDGKQFNIIGITTDDDADAALRFMLQAGVQFANYHDHELTWENMLGANRIPLTLLIDAHGRVLKKVRGSRQWDSLESVRFIGKTFGVKLPGSVE
jgi:thiol-disulfide isomerase/thioredoxin